jgi:phytoene dehydrogenase-like protein
MTDLKHFGNSSPEFAPPDRASPRYLRSQFRFSLWPCRNYRHNVGVTQVSVIGAGPNGLSAAIHAAMAGFPVEVFEAEAIPGGAARTLPLTLPGYLHDFGSAVHPMAAGSPFFRSLSLENHGLSWLHAEIPLAHPFDDGSAVVLYRDLAETAPNLGLDSKIWLRIMRPLANNWWSFAEDALTPILRFPNQPVLMARFGLNAMLSAKAFTHLHFQLRRTRALFAGLAAHSFMELNAPFSSAIGLVLAAAAHSVGWPIPRGGAQSITNALIDCLHGLNGALHTSRRISLLDELPHPQSLIFCDLTPRQLVRVAGDRLSPGYTQKLQRYRYGPGSFKIDYALSEPVPWRAPECRKALTLHLGGSFEEIANAESAVLCGDHPDHPFVLVSQPTICDPSRAPRGRHILWAYCHVPNGSPVDMTQRIEAQIERFAPGFRDCILARNISSPRTLESMDANLVGGDINGGAFSLRQLFFRPTRDYYATSNRHIYLCSASTPPGGGVHGMCGYHAVEAALLTRGA